MWRRTPSSEVQAAHTPVPAPQGGRTASNAPASLIGNDLTFSGHALRVICRGILQIDCEIEADIEAAEVIIDRKGRVTGKVAADRVVVRGRISGVIRAKRVVLEAPSEVHGDIHHTALAIDEGARFTGRSCPASDGAIADPTAEATGAEQHATTGIG